MATVLNEIVAVGRRKEATARVRVKPGTGQFTINGREARSFLTRDVLMKVAQQPLELTGMKDRVDITCRCAGGGLSGQAGALRLGIARALAKMDETHHSPLRKAGLLTRDAREVERKKYGQPGARKRFQFSKR